MLRILVNTSAIWLCSLLIYELLLKRLTFHRPNRLYMLLTFTAGILLPIMPWGNTVEIRSSAAGLLPGTAGSAGLPLEAAGGALPYSPGAPAGSPSWWLILYIGGAAISFVYLLRELVRLRRLYRRAAVHSSGGWKIAETGAEHPPFSLLNIIFVGSRKQYTDAQWLMVLQHEQQHFKSRHFLDLALLQSAIIVFWFHPLVYIYRKKLRLLHEYEVDSLQSGDIRSYGRFLLEQAAGRPLLLTHSFNFSPLKNRIRMMTKKTSARRAQSRFLLLLPMMSCFIWACTQNRAKLGVDIKDDKVSRRDVKLTFPASVSADTVMMMNPKSGAWDTVVMTREPEPTALNDQKILQREALNLTPHCLNPGETFGISYLLKAASLENTLKKMTDGKYYIGISDIIIDPQGRVAYYSMMLPERDYDNSGNPPPANGLSAADNETIQRKISEQLIGGDVAFTAVKDARGTAVPYFLDRQNKETAYKLGTSFTVKDHQVSFN